MPKRTLQILESMRTAIDENEIRLTQNIRGLKVFNRLISRFTRGDDNVHRLRQDAVESMFNNVKLHEDLISLSEVMKCRYPQWFNGTARKRESDPARAAKICRMVFKRLGQGTFDGNTVMMTPEEYHLEVRRSKAIRDKRLSAIHIGPRRVGAASRPVARTCTVHEGRKTVFKDHCALCYSRVRLVSSLGWLTPETPQERILELRRLPTSRGRKSKFRTWAYQILVEGRSPKL